MFGTTVAAAYLVFFLPDAGVSFLPFDSLKACTDARATILEHIKSKSADRVLICVKGK